MVTTSTSGPVDIAEVASHLRFAVARTARRLRQEGIAAEAGVKIVLNTDAHGVDTLDNMAYAVATARRAWLTAADVANTRGWREFSKLLKRD